MSFLSKHYEKIILASFLLIFIFALVYLIMVFSKSTEITEKDLILVRRQADYMQKFNEAGDETAPESKKQYDAVKKLGQFQTWNKSVNRDPNSPVSTDLVRPIEAARCPKCQKIIPTIYFKNKENCILCGEKLEELIDVKVDDTGKDTDGDGMPDLYESQNDLDPKVASDKMTDKDEDGFPNFIEFQANTKPNDPLSHSPLAERLALVKIKRNKIPLILYNVMKNGSEDKNKWLAQVKVQKRGRWKSEFKKIGETIKVGKDIFKINDLKFKEEEKFDRKLRQPVKKNVSEMIIENTLNDKDGPVVANMRKVVYENMKKIYMQDKVSEKRFILKVGDKFSNGNEVIGKESYKVISVNEKKGKEAGQQELSVTIQTIGENDKPGKEYDIKKQSMLDAKILEISGQEESKPKDEMMPPEDMF